MTPGRALEKSQGADPVDRLPVAPADLLRAQPAAAQTSPDVVPVVLAAVAALHPPSKKSPPT